MPATLTVPLAAAIEVEGAADVDALLAQVTRRCQARGVRVRGLLRVRDGSAEGCEAEMVMVDVHTGQRYPVSQALGSGALACRADPAGFARAGRVLHAAREPDTQLVVCNRFGGLEADGQGFADELLSVMADGIPLLTAVAARHGEAWSRFTGGAPILAPDPEGIQAWIDCALAQSER